MPEILEYVREKLDWAAGRILELLTGSSGYRVQEVKARVPDVRKVADSRQAQRLPPSGLPCDRY
ncbi:MAG: hypothetical protein ABSG91_13650 [Syntrophobacteraceae bacterium]|jgi:hypothetical protein